MRLPKSPEQIQRSHDFQLAVRDALARTQADPKHQALMADIARRFPRGVMFGEHQND